MHRESAQRIMARQPRAYVDAGEFVAMHGETRHFLIVQLQLDGHALVHVMREQRAPDRTDLLGIQQADVDQTCEAGIHLRLRAHLFAHQFELECGQVLGQHHPVAVENQSAARGYRIDTNPVSLRELGIVVMAQHLQIEEAGGDRQQQRRDDRARDDAARREDALLAPVILDAYAIQQRQVLRVSARAIGRVYAQAAARSAPR